MLRFRQLLSSSSLRTTTHRHHPNNIIFRSTTSSSSVEKANEEPTSSTSSLLMSDVHGTMHGKKVWRNKPLFRREGDKKFRNGQEASEMLYEEAVRRDPFQAEFLQSTKMLLNSISPVFDRYPKYAWVMKQLLEPERAVTFRVPWVDADGNNRVNRGYRVQFSSALGPYRGPLRFHKSINHGTIKFLALETSLLNALATSCTGGAAGGADFDPTNKTEAEIMRFCQSFMTELAKFIGPGSDIPTSGTGVGPREIGYMFGQYKRIRQNIAASNSGGIISGSKWYPEATGHGLAHFASFTNSCFTNKKVLISGSGATALTLALKLTTSFGAKVIGLSDSSGYVLEPSGFTKAQLESIVKIKVAERGLKIGAYIMNSTTATYVPTGNTSSSSSFWKNKCDYAFPCAAQNDITSEDATALVKNGCKGVFEGTPMPCDASAIQILKEHQRDVTFVPWKACNFGALAVEEYQSDSKSDAELAQFMKDRHDEITNTCVKFNLSPNDYEAGANIAAFVKVADAALTQGAV